MSKIFCRIVFGEVANALEQGLRVAMLTHLDRTQSFSHKSFFWPYFNTIGFALLEESHVGWEKPSLQERFQLEIQFNAEIQKREKQ